MVDCSCQWELFDLGNSLDNQWYDNLAAAVQGARSVQWRASRWVIFDPAGDIVRRYDSGEEYNYWRSMQRRGSANTGPIPAFD